MTLESLRNLLNKKFNAHSATFDLSNEHNHDVILSSVNCFVGYYQANKDRKKQFTFSCPLLNKSITASTSEAHKIDKHVETSNPTINDVVYNDAVREQHQISKLKPKSLIVDKGWLCNNNAHIYLLLNLLIKQFSTKQQVIITKVGQTLYKMAQHADCI